MRSVTTAMQIASRVLAQSQGWLRFLEIPSVTPGQYFRLVANPRPVTADGKVWQACEMRLTTPEERANGALGEMSITIPNVSRLPLALWTAGEVKGQIATVWFQHESQFAAFVPGLSWRHRITHARASELWMTFEATHPAGLLRVPSTVFTRDRWPQLLPQAGVQ